MITIDILGCKSEYSQIFDLNQYEKVKNKYMGKVLALRNKEQYYKEISALLEQEHIQIPIKAEIYALAYRLGLNTIVQKLRK